MPCPANWSDFSTKNYAECKNFAWSFSTISTIHDMSPRFSFCRVVTMRVTLEMLLAIVSESTCVSTMPDSSSNLIFWGNRMSYTPPYQYPIFPVNLDLGSLT